MKNEILGEYALMMGSTGQVSEIRHLLRRLTLHHDRWVEALCRHVGVSRSDYHALQALDEFGSLTPSELGTLLTLTSGAVTALIDRLEKLGWASRHRHPDDRRKVIVTLTQDAWQVGQGELKPYHRAIDASARQLRKEDRAVVVAFLEALNSKVADAPSNLAQPDRHSRS